MTEKVYTVMKLTGTGTDSIVGLFSNKIYAEKEADILNRHAPGNYYVQEHWFMDWCYDPTDITEDLSNEKKGTDAKNSNTTTN